MTGRRGRRRLRRLQAAFGEKLKVSRERESVILFPQRNSAEVRCETVCAGRAEMWSAIRQPLRGAQPLMEIFTCVCNTGQGVMDDKATFGDVFWYCF